MPQDRKYSGLGPYGTMPTLSGGKSRQQMMAEAKAQTNAIKSDPVRYLLGQNPKPKEVAELRKRLAREAAAKRVRDQASGINPEPEYPRDYPWMKRGWTW